MKKEKKQSVVNIRLVGSAFFIEVEDQYTKNLLAVSREELEKIVLYGQVVLTPPIKI